MVEKAEYIYLIIHMNMSMKKITETLLITKPYWNECLNGIRINKRNMGRIWHCYNVSNLRSSWNPESKTRL